MSFRAEETALQLILVFADVFSISLYKIIEYSVKKRDERMARLAIVQQRIFYCYILIY